MSVPSPFLINSFSSFSAYCLISFLLLTSRVFGLLTKLPSVKPKLKSVIGVD